MIGRRRFLSQAMAATAAGSVAPAVHSRLLRADGPALPLPVIDTHTHFYNPTRPGGVPWPGKDDALLSRPMLPTDWEKLVQPLAVTGTVVVEASPLVEDNQWLIDLADRHARERLPGMLGIVGVVGSLPLGDLACGGWIDRFAKQRPYRGIRVNGDKLLTGLGDKAYAADIARLADHDLSIDINGGKVFDAAAASATKFPQLRIIVNHMGNTPVSDKGPLPEWRDAIALAARHPNVFMKVSGLVEGTGRRGGQAPSDPAVYRPILDALWHPFGEDRLIYGSNWPVSLLFAPYTTVLQIVKDYFATKGPRATAKYFHRNAVRVYQLPRR